MKTSCGKFLNLAHYFPYDVKLRLLAHSRSFLANQKARNTIVGAENLLILISKFKKILYMGFRATLNVRKFKVALNPMYRIFLNFAKSCVLSCLSKVDNIKKFHRAVFEL